MEIIGYNVTGAARKELAGAVGEFIGEKAVYRFAPSFAFTVGPYTVGRDGSLRFEPSEVRRDEFRDLTARLAARGFEHAEIGRDPFEDDDASGVGASGASPAAESIAVCETSVREERPADPSDHAAPRGVAAFNERSGRLAIEMPPDGFTGTAFANLEKLIAGKAALIRKAVGAEALPVERSEDGLSFPWFNADASPEAVGACARFVSALCETAKKQRRVILKEKPLDEGASEKFAFRCFLLKLGFIGDEYKESRRILLANLSGNGSHKTGDGKKAAPGAAPAAIGHHMGMRGYRDCLCCGHSMSEPAENDGDSDRLFCVIKRDYVGGEPCEEFNCQGVADHE
ncbi:MAG: virulence protein [Clostridiales Family XIII bacterium]|jgi:hypothetical protein|nr:virulence protein [Clostridiales Family XIII bacterium]